MKQLADAFAIAAAAEDARLLPPSWNVAPTQGARVLVPSEAGLSLEVARWGLVPSWAKDPGIGSKMFNARSETAAEKPSFRSAFKRRRCVVPANGYYEWKKLADGKQPYFIHDASGAPLAFAGLYEYWGPERGDAVMSFSILTAGATGALAEIHDRTPVMLSSDAVEAWADPGADRGALEALMAAEGPEMATVAVGKAVGNVRNNSAELIEPVAG